MLRLLAAVDGGLLESYWERYSGGDKDVFLNSLLDHLRGGNVGAAIEGRLQNRPDRAKKWKQLCDAFVKIYGAFLKDLTDIDEHKILLDMYAAGEMAELRDLVARFAPVGNC
jgi:hypothetical protein